MRDHRCTVYRMFNHCGQLLYVGIADNAGNRMAQHAADKPWWVEITRIDLDIHASREAARLAEEAAIVRERPLYNKARPRSARVLLPLDPPAGGWHRYLGETRVYFTNAQWAVTEYGIECIGDSPYDIAAHRVSEMRGPHYEWPLHMAGKTWVKVDAFNEALRFALQEFPGHTLNEGAWTATMRELAARDERGAASDEEWEERTYGGLNVLFSKPRGHGAG